jgi:uncharacterized protein involved in cysteine biosynthesis
MYEHRSQPLIAHQLFLRRVARHTLAAGLILLVSLLAGILGYHLTENLGWIDALLNAAMILGGMGPVNTLHSTAGKLFAAFYALYAGIVFILTTGILGAPFVHRLLHRFHVERN